MDLIFDFLLQERLVAAFKELRKEFMERTTERPKTKRPLTDKEKWILRAKREEEKAQVKKRKSGKRQAYDDDEEDGGDDVYGAGADGGDGDEGKRSDGDDELSDLERGF